MDRNVTRRSLIQRALLVLGLDTAALVGCVSHRRTGGSAPTTAPDKTLSLLETEMECLVAFGEALVEGRTLGPAERRALVEHIMDQSQRVPGYVSLYRTTVRTLDRTARRPFTSLTIDERVTLIAREGMVSSPPTTAQEEDLVSQSAEVRTVRTLVVPDLIRGYYASAGGWAVVGYETFPGRCGNLTRYTRAEP
jgi:hypothetical protein